MQWFDRTVEDAICCVSILMGKNSHPIVSGHIRTFAAAFVTSQKPAGDPKALHPKHTRGLMVTYLTRMDELILDAKNIEVSETPMDVFLKSDFLRSLGLLSMSGYHLQLESPGDMQ